MVADAISVTTSSKPVVPDHELIRPIGRGAYGEVWLARNIMGTWRAVKVVYRGRFDDPRPFEREFAGIQRFEPVSRSHPSQVHILHIGRNEAEGYFYYVMELADDQARGQQIDPDTYAPRTIRSELMLRHRLPAAECTRLAFELTTALEHLHQSSLVHRDIKPSNIIFVDGRPKLADIGLVSDIDATRSYVGTEGYVPPEGPGTVQADVYGLGKVLYELVTGLDRQQFPELPSGQGIDLEEEAALCELNEVITRACDPEVKRRYPTAGAMLADIELLQAGQSLARLRGVEKRLRFVQRAGALVTAVAAVIAVGWYWQARQTGIVRQLAEEKSQLVDEKTRLAEENQQRAIEQTRLATEVGTLAEENRERLVRLSVANGLRLLDEDDPSGALLWFAQALPLVSGRPAEEEIHRIRIQQALAHTPRLLHIVAEEESNIGVLSPDGLRLISAHRPPNGGVQLTMRLVETGEVIWERLSEDESLRSVQFTADGRRLLLKSFPGVGPEPAPDSERELTPVLDAQTGLPTLGTSGTLNDAVPEAGAPRVVQTGSATIAVPEAGAPRSVQTGSTTTVVPQAGVPMVAEGIRGLFCLGFSADDRWMAVSRASHRIQVLETRDGRPVVELDGHTGAVNQVTFSDDGKLLASASDDRTARVWRLPSGELVGSELSHEHPVQRVALSADSRYLATATLPAQSTNVMVQVWNLETGLRVGETIMEVRQPRLLIFSPNGETLLFTGGDADGVRVWKVGEDVILLRTLAFPVVRCWAFSADHRRLALGTDVGFVSIWDTANWELLFPPLQHTGWVESVDFSADGTKLLTTSDDGTAKIWSLDFRLESARLELPVELDDTMPWNQGFPGRRPGLIPVYGTDQTLRLIDPDTLTVAALGEVLEPADHICGFGSSASGRYWSFNEHHLGPSESEPASHTIALWRHEADALRRIVTLPVGAAHVHDWAYTADESRFLTYSRETDTSVDLIQVWRVADGALERTIPVPDSHRVMWHGIMEDHFRPDLGAVLVLRAEPSDFLHLQLLDLVTGELTGKPFALGWKRGQPTRMRFSPDGTRLASVGVDQMGTIIDLQSGEQVVPPFKHNGTLLDLDWSPDGRRLLTAGLGGVRVWDASTGEMFGTPLQGEMSARWSADGRFIATRRDRNAALVYDAATTEPVTPRLRHSGYVRWASVTPGNRLITASDPNVLRAWDLIPTTLPAAVIADYAKLVSGKRLSASGVMTAIPAGELEELGRSLRRQYPELFAPPSADHAQQLNHDE